MRGTLCATDRDRSDRPSCGRRTTTHTTGTAGTGDATPGDTRGAGDAPPGDARGAGDAPPWPQGVPCAGYREPHMGGTKTPGVVCANIERGARKVGLLSAEKSTGKGLTLAVGAYAKPVTSVGARCKNRSKPLKSSQKRLEAQCWSKWSKLWRAEGAPSSKCVLRVTGTPKSQNSSVL